MMSKGGGPDAGLPPLTPNVHTEVQGSREPRTA